MPQEKEKSFNDLLTEAIAALDAICNHEDYICESGKWYQEFLPHSTVELSRLGLVALLEYLTEED